MEPFSYCQANALRYVDMLVFLERALGRDARFALLDPGEVPCTEDYNALARKIAEFLGITNHSFIVCKAKKAESISGTIEQDGRFNFIEISKEDYTHQNILAILSHEIMHRFLSLKGIGYPDATENEMLTDIATVYAGLGKLVLNGVYSETRWTERRADKQIVHTSVHRIGYLDFRSFCFIYLTMNKMRGIQKRDIYSHLNAQAVKMLKSLRSDPLYRRLTSCLDGHGVSKADRRLHALEGRMRLGSEKLDALMSLASKLKSEKTALDGAYAKLLEGIRSERDGSEYNPVMKKLKGMQNSMALKSEIGDFEEKLDSFGKGLARVQPANSPGRLRKPAFWKGKK